MRLLHAALVYGSERTADEFLVDVLGLVKSERKTLPRELARAIFGVDRELGMVNYANDSLQIEAFIDGAHPGRSGGIEHVCFEVHELANFLERCRQVGVEISRTPRGRRLVTFVRDRAGNLFEIKERQP